MAVTLQASFESLGARWGLTQNFARPDGFGRYIGGYASVLDDTIVELDGTFALVHNPSWPDATYEGAPIPYPYLGWPVFLTVPGDFYNAQVSDADPAYEFGGKYVESAIVSKLSAETFTYTSDGVGAYGGLGLATPGWEIKVVSQRCWVLLLIAPSMTRPADPPWDGAPEDKPTYWHDDPWEQPLGYGMFIHFGVRYRRGAGSGLSGVGFGSSGAAGGTPSSVIVGGGGSGAARRFGALRAGADPFGASIAAEADPKSGAVPMRNVRSTG